jgi:hypothetical protein
VKHQACEDSCYRYERVSEREVYLAIRESEKLNWRQDQIQHEDEDREELPSEERLAQEE